MSTSPFGRHVSSGLMLIFLLTINVQAQESLGNEEVIKLARAGVGEDVIIEMINTSVAKFAVDVNSLINLKDAGVPERVLLALLKKASAKPAGNGAVPSSPAGSVTLAADTVILVRLLDAVGTRFNRPGETFACTLEEPLVVDGVVVAERRAPVLGRIVDAQSSAGRSKVAQLELQLEQIQTVGGVMNVVTELVQETAEPTRGGGPKDAIAGSVGGALLGAAIGGGKGAIIGATAGGAAGTVLGVLTKTGNEIQFEPERLLSFRLKAPSSITLNPDASSTLVKPVH